MRRPVVFLIALALTFGVASAQQIGTTFNSETASGANAAVTTSIAATTNQRVRLYAVDARCSAGTSSVTVKDGVAGTTIFSTTAAEVTTARLRIEWPGGLASTIGNGMDIVLAACGAGNTGTLTVMADRY